VHGATVFATDHRDYGDGDADQLPGWIGCKYEYRL
jgi:hypothetical protein